MTESRAPFVLTGHDDLGGLDSTGFYVCEAADPWKIFTDACYQVDLALIAGGVPPEDGRNADAPTQQAFVSDPHIFSLLQGTARFSDDDPATYEIVFFVDGPLTSKGATHVPGPGFSENAVVGRLATGQNPQSALGVARAAVKVEEGR